MVGQGERTGDGFVGGDIYSVRGIEYVVCRSSGEGAAVDLCLLCHFYRGQSELDSNGPSGKSKQVLCSYGDKKGALEC